MAEHEKRIREALEAGPTEGPWASEVDDTNPNEINIISNNRPYVATVWPADASNDREQEANSAFIAACNPAAIRALLADLDAVRGALKMVDADWSSFWPLGPDVPSSSDRACAIAPETAEIWRAIRAALKGATHE